MPRTGQRVTIARGIYKDSGGYEVRITVGGRTYTDRMPLDSTVNELKAARAALEQRGRTETPKAAHGTLRKDASHYLTLVKHLASWDDREDHLDAWCALYGDLPRHRLADAHVLIARDKWKAQGTAPKTINHRCDTLRNLFHRLDGQKAPTPCDTVKHLPVPKTMIQRVSDDVILKVDANLQAREQSATHHFDGAKTRARFRVFVSTGKRPCEIMRAQPEDVNLKARVWVPRDAKGGYCPGVYLNDDMLEAWKLFIAADAWGPYNHGSFARVIRNAGWPANVRPYQARHTTWITASERGVDLSDIQVGAGHKDLRTTRMAYVPILNSRLQKMSEMLDGRFNRWGEQLARQQLTPAQRALINALPPDARSAVLDAWDRDQSVVPKSGSAKTPKQSKRKRAG